MEKEGERDCQEKVSSYFFAPLYTSRRLCTKMVWLLISWETFNEFILMQSTCGCLYVHFCQLHCRAETEEMLRNARAEQVRNKEHFLAVQAQRDRTEFERVLG